jgi:hypothetical protein
VAWEDPGSRVRLEVMLGYPPLRFRLTRSTKTKIGEASRLIARNSCRDARKQPSPELLHKTAYPSFVPRLRREISPDIE